MAAENGLSFVANPTAHLDPAFAFPAAPSLDWLDTTATLQDGADQETLVGGSSVVSSHSSGEEAWNLAGLSRAGVELEDWFDATGQVENFEALENGDVIISFRTRGGAEQVRIYLPIYGHMGLIFVIQGLAKGSNIPLAGNKQISWYTGASSSTVVSGKTAQEASAPRDGLDHDHSMENDGDRHLGEEELAPSGWGDGAEDDMGML